MAVGTKGSEPLLIMIYIDRAEDEEASSVATDEVVVGFGVNAA